MASQGGQAGPAAVRKKRQDLAKHPHQVPQATPAGGEAPSTPVLHPTPAASAGLAALILSRAKVQTIIEAFSLLSHGIHGVLAHIMVLIPDTPIKGVGFIGVLGVLVHWQGIRKPETQPLCFACFSFLAIISVGLIAVALRSPGRDERLQEGQGARIRALNVKPLNYGQQTINEDSRDYQR